MHLLLQMKEFQFIRAKLRGIFCAKYIHHEHMRRKKLESSKTIFMLTWFEYKLLHISIGRTRRKRHMWHFNT